MGNDECSPFETGISLMLKENNQRLHYLTDNEIKGLLTACPEGLRRIVLCALHTGMGRGEILSLKRDPVHNGFICLSETKTKEPRQIDRNFFAGEMDTATGETLG